MRQASERFLPPERVWGKAGGLWASLLFSFCLWPSSTHARLPDSTQLRHARGQDQYDGGLNGRPVLSLWTVPMCLGGRTGRLRKAGWISRLLVLLTSPFADLTRC